MKREGQQNTEQIRAVVQAVARGKHGPYATAAPEGLGEELSSPFDGSLTFAISEEVWGEKVWPRAGEVVVLSGFRKKRAGWRAMKARYLKPSDLSIES